MSALDLSRVGKPQKGCARPPSSGQGPSTLRSMSSRSVGPPRFLLGLSGWDCVSHAAPAAPGRPVPPAARLRRRLLGWVRVAWVLPPPSRPSGRSPDRAPARPEPSVRPFVSYSNETSNASGSGTRRVVRVRPSVAYADERSNASGLVARAGRGRAPPRPQAFTQAAGRAGVRRPPAPTAPPPAPDHQPPHPAPGGRQNRTAEGRPLRPDEQPTATETWRRLARVVRLDADRALARIGHELGGRSPSQ